MGIEEQIRAIAKEVAIEIIREERAATLANKPTTQTSLPEEGDIEFASSITGLSKGHIYNLKHKGLIPCKTWGKRGLLFNRLDLVEWMNEGMPDPKLEKAAEHLRRVNQ